MIERERQELNRSIAIEVMGWEPSNRIPGGWKRLDGWIEASLELENDFAGTWSGAGKVIERMLALGWNCKIELLREEQLEIGYEVTFYQYNVLPSICYSAVHSHAPTAFALAALGAYRTVIFSIRK